MVLNHYRLAEQPFGVTPDPCFLHMSATHREAMASVLYGVKSGRGFSALIAEPGMGKTTVLFNLLMQLGDTAKTAFLFQSHDTPRNFLRNLLLDFGIEDDGEDLVGIQAKLNECLVQETGQGKHFVVIIDEAQNLSDDVLEIVRMLSNFETPREKLLHIILAGQPQLAAKLASPQMLQLRQRISIVARLVPFNCDETRAYIDHRLRVAGYRGETPLFTDRALALIANHSGGIPRNINNICFNALSLGCAVKRRTIDAATIAEVLRDLDLAPLCADRPVLHAPAQNRSAVRNIIGVCSSIFSKRRVASAGIAVLAALLAGTGWTATKYFDRTTANPLVARRLNHE
jgi:general secretion pathway protein A